MVDCQNYPQNGYEGAQNRFEQNFSLLSIFGEDRICGTQRKYLKITPDPGLRGPENVSAEHSTGTGGPDSPDR